MVPSCDPGKAGFAKSSYVRAHLNYLLNGTTYSIAYSLEPLSHLPTNFSFQDDFVVQESDGPIVVNSKFDMPGPIKPWPLRMAIQLGYPVSSIEEPR